MKIIKKKLSELKHPERNIRLHSDKQIEEFKRSVTMFGQIRPIVIDENNVMLAGNGLYETLVALGETVADCYVVSGLTEKQKKKLMLADNRIFSYGIDDMDAFDQIIRELGDDLDVPGYDMKLLETLVADADNIDDLISDYGTISDEQKDELRASAERQERREAEQVTRGEEIQPIPTSDGEPSQIQYKYVICPKCGEKIWL